jgi:hypothetical protein
MALTSKFLKHLNREEIGLSNDGRTTCSVQDHWGLLKLAIIVSCIRYLTYNAIFNIAHIVTYLMLQK